MKTQYTDHVRFVSTLKERWNSLRRVSSGVIVAGAVFAAPLQAQIVFDATADFSINNGNPNGVWSYGWMPTDFSVFTAYTGVFSLDNLDWWWDSTRECPHIWKNLGPTSRAGVPPGRLSLHPGPGEEPSVLRWTSPLPGFVQIQGSFLPGNSGIMQVAVRRDGTTLWQATDSGAFALLGTVLPGDTFDFAVYRGYYSGDTALEALISLTPTGGVIVVQPNFVSVSESTNAVFLQVQRFGPEHLSEEVTVDYATVDGTAHAGEDYVAASGRLHFAAGETNKQITITILDNALKEPEEQFRLVLSNPTGGVSLGISNAIIRIRDDEPYYVNVNNPTPVFPYTSWATAATNIQDAVAAGTDAGRIVLVTNGVYRTGIFEADGPNRVVLTNQVTLRSVNGPESTIIDGGGSVRCVYLAADAVIGGFTLTNGVAGSGGGAYGGTLTNCTVTGNSADGNGGGACNSTLHNCTLTDNTAAAGWNGAAGGASSSTLYNCRLIGNSGAGTASSTLYNCTLTGNSGAGADYSTLYNCTLTDNSGGGANGSVLYNCIVYHNRAPYGANHSDNKFEYSCTSPLPPGPGNIDLDPQLASDCHLWPSSPCLGAGSAAYASGLDIDGEPWSNPPPMGADQVIPGLTTGALSLRIQVPQIQFAAGYPVSFKAQITGRVLSTVWDFGDGMLLTNQISASHAWTAPGVYTVRLTGYNDTFPAGVTSTVKIEVVDAIHYVNVANPSPVFPYTNWATAATNIQDAVAAGTVIGRLVLVTNGIYRTASVLILKESTGELTFNRVALTNPVVLRSVNGPRVTLIEGAPGPSEDLWCGIRCIYVGSGAIVSGFTLTNGCAWGSDWAPWVYSGGGGAYCEPFAVLTNCVLTGNSAMGYGNGGGVYGGILYNCTLTGNSAYTGGGASGSALYNCTLTENTVISVGGGGLGGGAYFSTLYSCTLTGNSAISDGYGGNGGGTHSSTLYSCMLTGNSAGAGGGAYSSTLFNCTLKGNTARQGGGVYAPFGFRGSHYSQNWPTNTLHNCRFVGNSAQEGGGAFGGPELELRSCILMGNSARRGGGAAGAVLYNCVVTENSADEGGGVTGAYGIAHPFDPPPYSPAQLRNCILYFNQAPSGANYEDASCEYSCTTPLPAGPGNIAADPQLAWDNHLLPTSPCVAAGNADFAFGRDMDGELWANPPSMGADQFVPGPVTGSLTMQIYSDSSQVASGYAMAFVAQNTGRLVGFVWDFGNGTFVTNQTSVSHAWGTPGMYTIRLTGYNDSHPDGVTTEVQVEVINAVHYVNVANPTPVFPYTSWVTAATNIQDAVAAGTLVGRVVLVTNGVYRTTSVVTGDESTGGFSRHRVALTNAVVLRSVNGPNVTLIEGAPGSTNFPGQGIRCVYVGDGALVSGFTLTNGVAYGIGGGGAYCEPFGMVTNCIITGNAGGGVYGGTLWRSLISNNSGSGAMWSTLHNCTLTGNSGVGASRSTLYSCTLRGTLGTGAESSTLCNCTVTGNNAGGAYDSTLYNCLIAGNYGGGANGSTLYNCPIARNYGDGASVSTLYGCTVTDNSGCGAYGSALYNCTVTGNDGGGVTAGSTLFNSIVYYNDRGNYEDGTLLNYCCTTPLPIGPGNIATIPQLTWDMHLLSTSPCVGAGSTGYAAGRDIDGEPWANPPCMGADQYVPGSVIGPLTMQIHCDSSQVATGFALTFATHNTGRLTGLVWDFGDGTLLTNQISASHAWTAPGLYTVRLTGYNDSYPAGVTTTVEVDVSAEVYYVNQASPTPTYPYTSWATAATNIQDAVTAGTLVGRLVLVTNGVYRTGVAVANGTNRVALTNTLILRSVNGPEVTTIEGASGGQPSRCAYVGTRAILSGFTLTNGSDYGAFCEPFGVVTNCIITGNFDRGTSGGILYDCMLIGNPGFGAYVSTLYNCTLRGNLGAGAAYCTLYNCSLIGNSTDGAFASTLYNCTLRGNLSAGSAYCTLYNCSLIGNSDYGAYYSTLYNCTLIDNSGAGSTYSTLYNCIVYYNTGGNCVASSLTYCCTIPASEGIGNITNAPLFVNPANNDFRLQPGSPCVDTGTNLTGATTTDILGQPRPMDGNYDGVARFDMGAYEFNPYQFEPALGLSADGFRFTIRGEPGKSVRIERSPDLVNWEFAGQIPIPASGQTLIDPAATTEPQLFYRALRVP